MIFYRFSIETEITMSTERTVSKESNMEISEQATLPVPKAIQVGPVQRNPVNHQPNKRELIQKYQRLAWRSYLSFMTSWKPYQQR